MTLFVLTLTLLGCRDAEPTPDAATDAQADADTDADADADADTDADTDTETGGATAETGTPPTGETGIDCSGAPAEVLELFVEARDASGPCATCTGEITLAAGIRNPCPFDLQVVVDATCPASGWSLRNANEELDIGVQCIPDPAVPVTIPANGGVVEGYAAVGQLRATNWEARAFVEFDAAEVQVNTTFQVQ